METEAKSDPQLRQLVGADKYETTWLNLSIPHATPPLLPDEPGYALPGAQRGRTAESFQQVLAADDKHSELRKGRARALQQQQQQQGEGQGQRPAVERLAYAADWLIGGWSQRGAQGYWDPDLTKGKPKQVRRGRWLPGWPPSGLQISARDGKSYAFLHMDCSICYIRH